MHSSAEPSRSAASLFADWRHSQDAGSGPPFDELLARHPAQAPELRKIHANYDRAMRLLGAADSAPSRGTPGSEIAPSVGATAPFASLLARLERHRPEESRYAQGDKIGRGGMGELVLLDDADLRRPVAKKSIRRKGETTFEEEIAALGRFVQEAQVTAQLAHPGVVPVHEMGIDHEGEVYFTMDLVRGRTLRDVYALMRRGDETWTRTRVVGALVRVCQTVAYAHSRGVLHRDLKPDNVMVGSFGEVYVMDWGLAKVLDRGRADDVVTEGIERALPPIATDRREEAQRDASSGLLTQTGQGAGTRGYMALEQVLGQIHDLDARTDVYALGALLYELLTGLRPYDSAIRQGDDVYVAALRAGKYVPIRTVAPDAPPELASICERALATDSAARFADAGAMAKDMQNWLDGRVVESHESGAWAELRKWVLRNKALATAAAVAVLAVVGGATSVAVIQGRRVQEVEHKQVVASVSAGPTLLAGLRTRAEEIWPSEPGRIRELEDWLTAAGELERSKPVFVQALDALRGESSMFARGEIDDGLREPLTALLATLDGTGLPKAWVVARLDVARAVGASASAGGEFGRRWDGAIRAIAASDKYGRMIIAPQAGLLPLREDPKSGLWEFWHVYSGQEPRLDPDTLRWVIGDETGIVLILIPGGRYQNGNLLGNKPDAGGATTIRPDDPLFDEYVGEVPDERWEHAVQLDPYFISKYEMTDAQWRRARNATPSRTALGLPAHPVDSVSWNEAFETVQRFALQLPTEAQWESAARGGAMTRYEFGREIAGLSSRAVHSAEAHEQVGMRKANAFGLHDVHGNVHEWCLDTIVTPDAPPRPGDGLRPAAHEGALRAMRGSGFTGDPGTMRLTFRYLWARQNYEPDTGVRPARRLER